MEAYQDASPPPVLVNDLLPRERQALLELLGGLDERAWRAPTVCPGWSVHDIALHLLGDDLGGLSRRRDHFTPPAAAALPPGDWAALVAFLNEHNQRWVEATRGLSPRLLCELLALSGQLTAGHFASLDPRAPGPVVSWAGDEPAPNWLDIAREYTERWTHQQQIRDAVGQPGLTGPEFLGPVLATFVRALPRAFRGAPAATDTSVEVVIAGPAGGAWRLERRPEGWTLLQGSADTAAARVRLSADHAWRLWTKGIGREPARRAATVSGDTALAGRVFDAVAIIA
jgi:uncharacterized protein (TIGR03083 family)